MHPHHSLIILLSILAACNSGAPVSEVPAAETPVAETPAAERVVTTPPPSLTQWLQGNESPLDPFYRKYVDCDGLPVITSENVSDEALLQACYIASQMLSRIPEARQEMIDCHFRIGVVGYRENITDMPECRLWPVWYPGVDWDERGRGYGATLDVPLMTIGEENLVRIPGFQERYSQESIMVHEFAHNVDFALRRVSKDFNKALRSAFKNAQSNGLWKDTYSMTNSEEYFAEGAQAWYNSCRMVVPAKDGSGSFKLKTREQLKEYDPALYELLAGVFPEEFLTGYHFE